MSEKLTTYDEDSGKWITFSAGDYINAVKRNTELQASLAQAEVYLSDSRDEIARLRISEATLTVSNEQYLTQITDVTAENIELRRQLADEWIAVEDARKPERETSAEDDTEYESYSVDVFVYGWDDNGEERIETGWYDFSKSTWESGSCEAAVTHWKPIHIPKTPMEQVVEAAQGVTFLPECKWQTEGHRNQTLCDRPVCGYYGQPCDKRCEAAEKETK